MILQKILDFKRLEVEELKKNTNHREIYKAVEVMPPARSMFAALKKPGSITLLAEIKKASPSKGIIRADFDPAEIASIYSRSGADAISVLTDSRFFAGHPDYIPLVKKLSALPVLRKDFIIDPLQVYQSRHLGADAILLICAALSRKELEALMKAACDSGLEAIVEVHDERELETALAAGAGIIGINNRDLKTFKTDIGATLRLCGKAKAGATAVISESGINSRSDMEMLKEAGADAALVGEALMRADDIVAKVRELRYGN
ncbi:MAG: indole-3-glycerol phosphate synthase TrpC [Bacillota bacterium]